jgi:serum/glucocorticoid-regulated kinase 2
MGNTGFTEIIKPNQLDRSDFHCQYAIGRGGFGKVWVVEFRSDRQMYAMKEMLKLRIVSKQSVSSVLNEQKLLSVLRHPFIVNMKFAFQDRENLFLVMDLMKGGDLRYHLNNRERFNEEESKFFTACIVTGLEYLHVNNIIHRDIKPENLVLDNKGYLRITDFGIARILSCDNSRDTSGTPGYMAYYLVKMN